MTLKGQMTLKDNSISLEEVQEKAKVIGIHDFIMSLPGGYNYNVKERGVMLSVGQRQLIAFLRASVSKPGILILDEATSSIDSYSEKLIQEATEKLTKNRTSIIIAHRLATIQKADKIIVMENGLIVEQGSHAELLDKKGPFSFYESLENRKECCFVRKVIPLKRALEGNEVWITGLRASQSNNRSEMKHFEWDAGNEIVKYNPLMEWSLEQAKGYIKEHNILYFIQLIKV